MDENSELKKLYSFLQGAIYFFVILDFFVFVILRSNTGERLQWLLQIISKIPIFENILFSKFFIFVLIITVSIGTRAKKNLDLDALKHIVIPLISGLLLFFGSSFLLLYNSNIHLIFSLDALEILYLVCSMIGAMLINISFDNISKRIKNGLMKDRFNVENESFEQNRKLSVNNYSVNIPTLFYYKKRSNKGWINIENPFRGTLLIGVPGSGKTFSVVLPFIKQQLKKGFSMLVYDVKFPDLAKVTYNHYLLGKSTGILKKHKYHSINLTEIEYSRRINPLSPKYLPSLADVQETAEALVNALRKGMNSAGNDQFFTQSAINFLTAIIYFLSRYEDGKYSTFPHVLAFISRPYNEIFSVLFTEPELRSILSPFESAYKNKAFDQLEGQIGTLRINVSRLATKEVFWVFTGDDFDLKISDPKNPSVLTFANYQSTQSITGACCALVLNRISNLINQKGNIPCSLIIDEIPTLYFHKIDNLLATARSNKVAILLGLQELPQFKQNYGQNVADTITSICGNVFSGTVRNKTTLDWLEKLFGKVSQIKRGLNIDRTRTNISMNEQLDSLIPASKIANLKAGELVGQIASDTYNSKEYISNTFNCRVNLNVKSIQREENKYIDPPKFYNFGKKKKDILLKNYNKIFDDITMIVNDHTVINK